MYYTSAVCIDHIRPGNILKRKCTYCHPQAFSIPVIQVVYETLKDEQEGKRGRPSIKAGGASEAIFCILCV